MVWKFFNHSKIGVKFLFTIIINIKMGSLMFKENNQDILNVQSINDLIQIFNERKISSKWKKNKLKIL